MPIRKSIRRLVYLACSFVALAAICTPASAAVPAARPAPSLRDTADVDRLFRDDIVQAAVRLRWKGEPLVADTAYALALTGASWEPAWGKTHLFSMAWGDLKRLVGPYRSGGASDSESLAAVRSAFEGRRYAEVVSAADRAFSPARIACDPALKEPVGLSLLELGKADRAFEVFAAPFDPSRARGEAAAENLRFRQGAFDAARRSGKLKESIAFAASLLLEPDAEHPDLNRRYFDYLESVGVEVDHLLIGVLQAPERLRALSGYYYAAASLLVSLSSPRLLPLFIHLAKSDDVYLRSRAVMALGVVAYQPDSHDFVGWERRVLPVPLKAYGLSETGRAMILQEIHSAATSDHYRLRIAAAVAAAFVGGPDSFALLRKLAEDRAYTLSPAPSGGPRARIIRFPVRVAAVAALARFSSDAETGNGELSGRALQQARRGGQDVTNDRRNLRSDVISEVFVSPLDEGAPVPLEPFAR